MTGKESFPIDSCAQECHCQQEEFTVSHSRMHCQCYLLICIAHNLSICRICKRHCAVFKVTHAQFSHFSAKLIH